MSIIKYKDSKELIPCKNFPYAKLPFDTFNCVQSRVLDFYKEDANALIAAPTGVGKSLIGEMYLSHEIRKNKRKGIYLAPYKALTQERVDDWLDKNHHFRDLKVLICTGDYRVLSDRSKDFQESDLIILTSEMLNSKSRLAKLEKEHWLKEIGVLISDESHLIHDNSRGSHVESGIMKFTELNPDCRVVFLSATMPNVDDLAKWLSSLNNKDTNVLVSHYRPCPLHIHFEEYQKCWKYHDTEIEKVLRALWIIKDYPLDKFIIFAHTKKTGHLMKEYLQAEGIECEFHHANLTKEKRIKLENRFREDPLLRVIIGTSTLSTGLNMPARRVVILGVHRGLSLVDSLTLHQECGRAGRPKYDKVGDAHVLLPNKEFHKLKKKALELEPIKSGMLNRNNLVFHIISEINHGYVQTTEDIQKWHRRTLAYFQNDKLDDKKIKEIVMALEMCNAIYQEDGIFKITSIGKIASLFYYSPFDIYDLKVNFDAVFDNHKENNDYWVSMALGNTFTYKNQICNKDEAEAAHRYSTYVDCLRQKFRGVSGGSVKAGFCYYSMLDGDIPLIMRGFSTQLKLDLPRLTEVLNAIDSMCAKWNMKDYFAELTSRINYGVSSEMTDIVKIKGIGTVKAKKLWDADLKTLQDISSNPHLVASILKCKPDKAEMISDEAKKLI